MRQCRSTHSPSPLIAARAEVTRPLFRQPSGYQGQESSHGGPICRALADVVETDQPLWINQDIASPLMDITGALLEATASDEQSQVKQPGPWPPQIPETSGEHAIVVVQATLCINIKGEPFLVGFHRQTRPKGFKTHHPHLNLALIKFLPSLPQLCQMFLTGQSGQMAVKDEEQPPATKSGKALGLPPAVYHFKIKGSLTNPPGRCIHFVLLGILL